MDQLEYSLRKNIIEAQYTLSKAELVYKNDLIESKQIDDMKRQGIPCDEWMVKKKDLSRRRHLLDMDEAIFHLDELQDILKERLNRNEKQRGTVGKD